MTKYTRFTGKVFGSSATSTGDDPEIGQFGSALAGTYNGTTDVTTIQSLPAWQKGFIGCVTPNTQFPPLPEMTGFGKVLSQQICYLLQQGIAEWDSGTTYYENNWCAYQGKLYISKSDENLNNLPTNTVYWTQFTGGYSRNFGEIVTSSLPIIDDNTLHLADGSLLSQQDYPEFLSYVNSVYSETKTWEQLEKEISGNYRWRSFAYGNNKIAAIADNENQPGAYTTYNCTAPSPTWVVGVQSTLIDFMPSTITYGNGTFVSIGRKSDEYSISSKYICYSTDGIDWNITSNRVEALGTKTWRISYGTSKFVAISTDGYISTSQDGLTWTTAVQSTELGSNNWNKIIFDGTKFIAIGDGGYISTSQDGTTWTTAVQNTNLGNHNWTSLAYGNGGYIAVSVDGYTSTSTNGTTWTTAAQNTELAAAENDIIDIIYEPVKGEFMVLTTDGYTSYSTIIPGSPFVTEEDWQATYATYGECGKYVYNAQANTVRIPLYNSYFTNTVNIDKLGELTPASIPNITGSFGGAESYNEPQWNTGAFYATDQNTTDGGSTTKDADLTHFDASRVSDVYSDTATTVNTQSTKQLVYIVVAK